MLDRALQYSFQHAMLAWLVLSFAGVYASEPLPENTSPLQAEADRLSHPRQPLTPERPRLSEPIKVDGGSYDLVIYGGTPGGIAMAVRAAREGLDVLLLDPNQHFGGILSSGLRVWDTLYEGKRSPIYDETRQGIFGYYRDTYGEDSPQYQQCLPGKSGHTNGLFEPAVAEHVLTGLLNSETRISMLTGFTVASVQRDGALLRSVTFRPRQGAQTVTVTGKIFADCSYEGDFAAACQVPYRVGRESREEFDEPHAGVIYLVKGQPSTAAERRQSEAHQQLNLRPFRGWQITLPGSTGESDQHVQAFNYRAILTDDPAIRLPVTQPAGYDRDFIATLEKGSVVEIPNRKFGWNRPQLIGPQDDYVEGDWSMRQGVMDQHWQATLGMLYFLQNDKSVPLKEREYWRKLGLASDEFPDNGHRPYEIYVRESRRIEGRYIFTQHDGSLPDDLDRAPVHSDSVGVTEWYFDSHACTPRRTNNSLHEGKMMLHESTFPGQVPYRCLLPQGLDNLLVPVCLSCTHVAWGTIRLEPTWMHIAESAAHAAALAIQNQIPPAQLEPERLIRKLASSHIMLSFFNDLDVASNDPQVAAAQYFSTKGFFHDYNARLDEPLTEAVEAAWDQGLAKLQSSTLDPIRMVHAVQAAESETSARTNHQRGEFLLSQFRQLLQSQ